MPARVSSRHALCSTRRGCAVRGDLALGVGARLARTELHARLRGAHSDLHLNAAQLAARPPAHRLHQRDRPRRALLRLAPDGEAACSPAVLAACSRAVSRWRASAQKTDGYQMNQALLLSPEAEIDSKPELEIFADDVKCSHGATVGELDAEQLFYLRSRGIAPDEARAMLVRAFLDRGAANRRRTMAPARCWKRRCRTGR